MNKFDCLVHELLLIRELTPSLNVQLSKFSTVYLFENGGHHDVFLIANFNQLIIHSLIH